MRRQRGAQFLRQVQRKRAGFNANLLHLILLYLPTLWRMLPWLLLRPCRSLEARCSSLQFLDVVSYSLHDTIVDCNQSSVSILEMSTLLFMKSEASVGAFYIHVLSAEYLFKRECNPSRAMIASSLH